MARTIVLSDQFQRDFVPNVHDCSRLVVTAAGTNVTSKVFAYRALPLQPGQSTPVAAFSHVCSPVDLEEFPEDQPAGGSPWFRLATVDILCRARTQADETYADIRSAVESLLFGLAAADVLVAGTPITITA